MQLLGKESAPASLKTTNSQGLYLSGSGAGIRVSGKDHEQVEVSFGQELPVVVQPARSGAANIQVYFPIAVGDTTAGQVMESRFTIKAWEMSKPVP